MKIAVIGPGAMGMLFGSYLSQKHDVILVGTNPAKMQTITESGVTIREMDGSERTYHPRATADTAALSPVDLVIVQVKASASEAALTKNQNLIGPETILMTLQNGMGHDALLSRFAVRGQIVIGTTQQGSYKLGEASVCHSGLGKTFLGAVTGDSARFAALAGVFAEREAILHKMADRIIHRGPDMEGYHLSGDTPKNAVALGFRRLSIIDLAAGKQPMYNEDGTVVVVFNGEIFNFMDLRAGSFRPTFSPSIQYPPSAFRRLFTVLGFRSMYSAMA